VSVDAHVLIGNPHQGKAANEVTTPIVKRILRDQVACMRAGEIKGNYNA
jgi:hypothetical protein